MKLKEFDYSKVKKFRTSSYKQAISNLSAKYPNIYLKNRRFYLANIPQEDKDDGNLSSEFLNDLESELKNTGLWDSCSLGNFDLNLSVQAAACYFCDCESVKQKKKIEDAKKVYGSQWRRFVEVEEPGIENALSWIFYYFNKIKLGE